jgi:hypothetical protein
MAEHAPEVVRGPSGMIESLPAQQKATTGYYDGHGSGGGGGYYPGSYGAVSHGPGTYQDHASSGFYQANAPPAALDSRPYTDEDEKRQARKDICGLRRPTFWLLLVLAVVIVGAAVGGSVGGVAAVNNSRNA